MRLSVRSLPRGFWPREGTLPSYPELSGFLDAQYQDHNTVRVSNPPERTAKLLERSRSQPTPLRVIVTPRVMWRHRLRIPSCPSSDHVLAAFDEHIWSYYVLRIQTYQIRKGKRRVNVKRLTIGLSICSVKLFRHGLELSLIPGHRGVVQAGKNVLYPRPCVAVLQPTQRNDLPKFVGESKSFRSLRFLRPDPFHDRVGS